METFKVFRYQGLMRFNSLFSKAIGVFIFLIILLLLVSPLLIYLGWAHSSSAPGESLIILTIIIFFFFGWSSTMPFWPEIQIDDEGLLIESFWKPRRVSWDKVIDIKQVKITFITHRFWLVRTRALTPFHAVYSFFYSGSFAPGFVISSNINDCETLVAEIKRAHHRAYLFSQKKA